MTTGRWDVNAALSFIKLVGLTRAIAYLRDEGGFEEYLRVHGHLVDHERHEIFKLMREERPDEDEPTLTIEAAREVRHNSWEVLRAEAFAEAMNYVDTS